MTVLRTALVMIALAVAGPVAAQGRGYDRCVAGIDRGGFVKSQMLDCATTEMDRADATLNTKYKTVIERLNPQRRTRLVIQERAWIAARRRRCNAAARDAIPSPEINRMLCLVRETDARTAVLRAMH